MNTHSLGLSCLVGLLAAGGAQAQLAGNRVLLSGVDNFTGLQPDAVRAQPRGTASISSSRGVTAVVRFVDDQGATHDALIATNNLGESWDLIVDEGLVVDAASGLTVGDVSGEYRDAGDIRFAVLQSFKQGGLRSLYVHTGSDRSIVSDGGVQCPGQPDGILQQGGPGRVLMNRANDVAFFDCGGVALSSSGTTQIVPIENPPPGATGTFMDAPTLLALDVDGNAWLRATTTCAACPGGAMHGVWRTNAGALELVFDSSAHPALGALVFASLPVINASGDFASYAYVGDAGAGLFANSVIRVTGGTVSVIARVGDEAVDRPGRPITSVLINPNNATGAFLTDDGTVIFIADVANPPGQAVFRSTGGTLETLLMTEDVVDEVFSGSRVVSLSAAQMAVSRTGHVAVGGQVERTENLLVVPVLFLDGPTTDGLVPALAPDQELAVDVLAEPVPVNSFFAPLVVNSTTPGFLGGGTSADGFSEAISDDGVVLASVTTSLGTSLVAVGLAPAIDITLSLTGPTEPIPEQGTFLLTADVAVENGPVGEGTITFTINGGQLLLGDVLPAACTSDEDVTGLTEVICTQDLFVTPSVTLSFFVTGPDPIEIFAHVVTETDEDVATFTATTRAPAFADVRLSIGALGALIIENLGPDAATNVMLATDRVQAGVDIDCFTAPCAVRPRLEAGEQVTYVVFGDDDTPGAELTFTVSATESDPNEGNNTLTASTDIVLEEDPPGDDSSKDSNDDLGGCTSMSTHRRTSVASVFALAALVVCVGRRRRG